MKKRTLLYIMSPSYSGSTLLTRLLAESKAISTIGELKATGIDDIYTYQCSCGAKFLQCPFWIELAERLQANGVAFDLTDVKTRVGAEPGFMNRFLKPNLRGPVLEAIRQMAIRFYPGAHHHLQQFLSRSEKIIDQICEIQGGELFLDESKDPLRAMYFYDSGLWDFRLVRLFRDGRGAVNSDIRHNHRGLDAACREWNLKIDEMQRFVTMRSCERMDVTYEQLCLEPESTLSSILEFAGVDTHLPAAGSTQHIIGNDMRLKPMRAVSLDEKWRKDLTDDELQKFYQLSGSRNRTLGYADE